MMRILLVALFGLAAGLSILILYKTTTGTEEMWPFAETERQIRDVPAYRDWVQFDSADGKFTIKLPTFPTSAADELLLEGTGEKVRYDLYATQTIDSASYLITVITYPRSVDASIPELLMQRVILHLVGGKTGNWIERIQRSDYRDLPAMEFLLRNEQATTGGQLVAQGSTLVSLTYMQPTHKFDEEQFRFFLNSLQVK